MNGVVAPPGAVVVPQMVERVIAVDSDGELGVVYHDGLVSPGQGSNTSGNRPYGDSPEKTKQPDLVQAGLFAKSRWRLRSGRCLLALHIVKELLPHLGTLATPVARLPDTFTGHS